MGVSKKKGSQMISLRCKFEGSLVKGGPKYYSSAMVYLTRQHGSGMNGLTLREYIGLSTSSSLLLGQPLQCWTFRTGGVLHYQLNRFKIYITGHFLKVNVRMVSYIEQTNFVNSFVPELFKLYSRQVHKAWSWPRRNIWNKNKYLS